MIEWLATALKDDEIGTELGEALEKVSHIDHHHHDSGLICHFNEVQWYRHYFFFLKFFFREM